MSMRTVSFFLCFVALVSLPVFAMEKKADGFAPIVAQYEAIRAALARDESAGAAEHAAKIRALAGQKLSAVQAGVPESAAAELSDLLTKIAEAAGKVAAAQGLEPVREAFGELSAPIVRWFELRTDKGDWAVAYCPMVDKSWLQPKAPEVNNPYYGSQMLTCGRFVEPTPG